MRRGGELFDVEKPRPCVRIGIAIFFHHPIAERAVNWRRHPRKELNCQPQNGRARREGRDRSPKAGT